jgi:hypothetical protein
MGFTVITSAAGHHRIARGRDWLNARAPTEEILIIGATLGAANEIARALAQAKRASFGCHRLTFRQLASALARPVLAAQRTVPLAVPPRGAAWSFSRICKRKERTFWISTLLAVTSGQPSTAGFITQVG